MDYTLGGPHRVYEDDLLDEARLGGAVRRRTARLETYSRNACLQLRQNIQLFKDVGFTEVFDLPPDSKIVYLTWKMWKEPANQRLFGNKAVVSLASDMWRRECDASQTERPIRSISERVLLMSLDGEAKSIREKWEIQGTQIVRQETETAGADQRE